jgi:molybdate transport system regulatory protein
MELRFKIWLAEESDAGGGGILGEGRFQLLFAIDRAGSLRKAAEQLGISYRKAWGDIRAAETHLGFELVNRQRGGNAGGSSVLTERARQLLQAFEEVKTKVQSLVTQEFDKQIDPILDRD